MVKLEEPDKGHAWVVAIAASLISMILAGLSRGSGLLYVAIISTYGVSRQDAAQPFFFRIAIRSLAGPIVGVIGQTFGVKAATFLGGVVASLGITLCYIAPNVFWLTVFWGGLYGFGLALGSTLFYVVINQYFVKYRATASGIAVSGTSIGTFLIPVLTEVVLDAFGLSGAFLILGGVAMHALPLSLLLKSPQWIENAEQYARLKELKMKQQAAETIEKGLPEAPPEEGRKVHMQECRGLQRPSSLDNCPVEELDNCSTTISSKAKTTDFTFKYFWNLKGTISCKNNEVCNLSNIKESHQLVRKNSFMNGSTMSTEKYPAIPTPTISGDLEKKKNNIDPRVHCGKRSEVSSDKKTSLLQSIRGIGAVHTNPVFVLISVCMITFTCAVGPVHTVVVDYGKDKGISESYGIYFINAIGMGDLIGKLCFGLATDKKFLSIPVCIALAFILKGVFLLLLPLITDLYSYMLLLSLYGATVGTILTHFPLLILRYVDINLQSVAMGCEGFLSGIVSFALPLMVGYFRDDVGSYDGMFYLMGTMSVVSGCFWFLIPSLVKFQRKKEEQNIVFQEKMKMEQHFEEYKSTGMTFNVNEQNSNSQKSNMK